VFARRGAYTNYPHNARELAWWFIVWCDDGGMGKLSPQVYQHSHKFAARCNI